MALNTAFNIPTTEIVSVKMVGKQAFARTGNFNQSEAVADLIDAPIVGQLYPIFYAFILCFLLERLIS